MFDDDNERIEEIKPLQEYANKYPIYATREEEFAVTSEYYDLKSLLPLVIKSKNLILLYLIVNRKQQLENDIINRNFRLVFKAARSSAYANRGLTLYDRVIAGLDGLIYCTRHKFNPYFVKNGNRIKFSTYATVWIKQRIGKAIEKYGSMVKTPGQIKEQQSKIRMVVREYCAKSENKGNKPSAEKISFLLSQKYKNKDGTPLEISPETIAELGRLQWDHTSLDETVDDGTMTVMDFLSANDTYLPDETTAKVQMRESVLDLVAKLEPTESLVISYKYGLIDSIDRKGTQIAALLGLTMKQYAAIESSALSNLRKIIPPDYVEFLR